MPRKILENKQEIERHLNIILKDLEDSSYNFYDLISENLEKYKPLFTAIYKNEYISSNYDIEAIIQIFHYTYQTSRKKTSVNLINNFIRNIKSAYNEWLIIFPLDYNKLFSDFNNFKKSMNFGSFELIPPQHNINKFYLTFTRKFGSPNMKESLADFLRRGRESLFNNPLLCLHLHGARMVVFSRSLNYFRHFKKIHDVYIAYFNKRNDIFNELQYKTNHFYLLNQRNGEIEGYPLREGSRVLFRFDKKIMLKFKQHNMDLYSNFCFKKQNNLLDRIQKSLYFFSKGFNERDSLSRFIFYVISMECLFSKDIHTPLRVTLSDYIALLCYSKSKRIRIHKEVRDIYDLRSSVVHGGNYHIPKETIEEAEKISAKAICQSLKLFKKFYLTKDPESKFFNYLLNLKLK